MPCSIFQILRRYFDSDGLPYSLSTVKLLRNIELESHLSIIAPTGDDENSKS
jgi:hypothetical protein